jgi:hypothetical protein
MFPGLPGIFLALIFIVKFGLHMTIEFISVKRSILKDGDIKFAFCRFFIEIDNFHLFYRHN